MNDEFDNRLKSHIANIFDNYEDSSADEGWALLREKYPAKQNSRPIAWLWWGSVAAGLLMMLGFGLWLNRKPGEVKLNAAVNKVSTTSPYKVQKIDKQITKTQKNTSIAKQSNELPGTKAVIQNRLYAARNYKANKNALHTGNSNHQKKETHNTVKNVVSSLGQPLARQPNNPDKANHIAIKSVYPAKADSAALVNAPTIKPADTANATLVMVKPEVKEPTKTLFITDTKQPAKAVSKASNKKVSFGLYAATYFNYAKGSDNEFNVGAGFTSDIKIVGGLKLSTGIAITQNSLNYRSPTAETVTRYASSADAAKTQTSAPNTLASASFNINPPAFKSYQASLIGLDVPINLKYQFANNDNYISAGLSSGTFINETYNYVFDNPAPLANSSTVTQQQSNKTQNSFSTFDFARTLNLSFGVGYPLGKKNRLIIEPFLKYPLNGLGSQQIYFGAGGVNLKLNFRSGKK